ncbi:oligosaccharyl transferase, archaeosortase A system-associated [candidate division WOR-3 bacterium]|nr:oligosaccharyl transferase, archaeosortase A system-associated [candidate division WOR-3 bacterium]
MKNEKLIYGCILAGIFFLSLYIRGILPYLSSGISISGNDPWYNYHLLESTLHNFPHRIFYDAYTYYPHGMVVPFVPFFDYLVSTTIWIIGLGYPYAILGEEGIKAIFVWFPVVLGALCVIPVYLIGKELWNRNAGLIGALIIAILPGQVLNRSMIGFTDHHIAEVLFITIAILMFILSIKIAKQRDLHLAKFFKQDWKKPFFYAFLSGIALSVYFLSWNGASLIIFVFLLYAPIQYTIDHFCNKNTDYLTFTALITFSVTIIAVLPFLFVPHTGLVKFQLISLLLALVVFVILALISKVLTKRQIDTKAYPLAILILGLFSFIVLSIFVPSLYQQLIGSFATFTPNALELTIQEVHPMSTDHILNWFSTTFFVAFVGFWFVMRNIRNEKRPEEILFLVWCLVMLFACFGQNRFAYYYAVNVALLCGVGSWKLIELASYKKQVKRLKGKSKKNKKQKKTVEKTLNKTHAVIVCTLIFIVVVFPPMSISMKVAKYTGGVPYDWVESLEWMHYNTPEPGVDYYGIYEVPPEGEDYNYPESAYGVMSWWDYGHWITTIAHRIPNANPFQAGIGGPIGSGNPGACNFFIVNNEADANKVADALGVRYVVGDIQMAMGKFGAMTVWAGDTGGYYIQINTGEGYKIVPNAKYYSTMEARLHVLDGRGVMLGKDLYIEPLQHYRLIHESPSTTIIVDGHEIKYVKIFEYVKGARIVGNAPNGSLVEVATNITTNRGRKFVYSTRMISNGSYEFVVPYSTGKPVEGGTNFDVFASPYKIRIGHIKNETVVWDSEKEVSVLEETVMEGGYVRL